MITPRLCSFLSLFPVVLLPATGSIAQTVADKPVVTASSGVSMEPNMIRFGKLPDALSSEPKMMLVVDSKSRVSGVPVSVFLKGSRPEDVKAALASFFSHKGAVSRWEKEGSESRFVLSSNYDASLDDDHWGRKMVALFDDVLKYKDLSKKEKEAFKDQRSLYGSLTSERSISCLQMMSSAFSRSTIESLLHGRTKQTLYLKDLRGENLRIANEIYREMIRFGQQSPADDPKLDFEMQWFKKERTATLWIKTKGKDGPKSERITRENGKITNIEIVESNSAGANFLGAFFEEEAQEELDNLWFVKGDERVALPQPTTGWNPNTLPTTKAIIPNGSYWEKFTEISNRFNISVIAFLPLRETAKELTVSSLYQTLRDVYTEEEPLLYKKRDGILLICPASFFGERGVSAAFPLATIRTINAAPKHGKDGFASILEYARLTESASDVQIENHRDEIAPLSVVSDWRPLLRALLRDKIAMDLLESGEPVTLDKRLATAVNSLLKRGQPDARNAVASGYRLQLTERQEPGFVLPSPYPKDFLVMRILTLQVTAPDGKIACTITANYGVSNPKYAKDMPEL